MADWQIFRSYIRSCRTIHNLPYQNSHGILCMSSSLLHVPQHYEIRTRYTDDDCVNSCFWRRKTSRTYTHHHRSICHNSLFSSTASVCSRTNRMQVCSFRFCLIPFYSPPFSIISSTLRFASSNKSFDFFRASWDFFTKSAIFC